MPDDSKKQKNFFQMYENKGKFDKIGKFPYNSDNISCREKKIIRKRFYAKEILGKRALLLGREEITEVMKIDS